MTVGSVLIPRFSLLAALGGRREMLTEPTALAPQPGREQAVGETSGSAEAFGIRAGMPISEALGRCPQLTLVPPDPSRTAAAWERILRKLEGIGAAVESGPARRGVLRGRRAAQHLGTAARGRPRQGRAGRRGSGPDRRRADPLLRPRRGGHRSAAASGAAGSGWSRPGRERDFLAPLADRPARPAASRPGRARRRPRRAAGRHPGAPRGRDPRRPGRAAPDRRSPIASAPSACTRTTSPRASTRRCGPRLPHEDLVQAIGLPEAAYGTQLERALDLLIERLLGDPRREGRAIRSLSLEARLAGGGSWSVRAAMRSASSSADRLRLALAPRLGELTAPVTALALRALELAPAGGSQSVLGGDPAERRRERLAEAVKQVRAAAGGDSVLRVLDVDPDSRVPERWTTLAPFNDPGGAGR